MTDTPLLVAAPSPVFVMWLAIGLAAVLFVWALALIAQQVQWVRNLIGTVDDLNEDVIARDALVNRHENTIALLRHDLTQAFATVAAHAALDIRQAELGERTLAADARERELTIREATIDLREFHAAMRVEDHQRMVDKVFGNPALKYRTVTQGQEGHVVGQFNTAYGPHGSTSERTSEYVDMRPTHTVAETTIEPS